MVAYQSHIVRSPRRVRVTFTSALAPGAFAASWFRVVSMDGLSQNPPVYAAIAVQGLPNDVELVLGSDLAPGALYELRIAAGVPALDVSVAAGITEQFRTAAPARAPSQGFTANDLESLVFGIDIIHDGYDFVEDADGDLATVAGPENVKRAVTRRLVANGLPYDQDYGGKARQYVDAPSPLLPALRGQLERQARQDVRVKSVSEMQLVSDENDGKVYLRGKIDLVGKIPVHVGTEVR